MGDIVEPVIDPGLPDAPVTAEAVMALEPGARAAFNAMTALLPDDVKTQLWLDLEAFDG